MTLSDARRIAAALEDILPDADEKTMRLLSKHFPEFNWLIHQRCPPIIMVGTAQVTLPLRW